MKNANGPIIQTAKNPTLSKMTIWCIRIRCARSARNYIFFTIKRSLVLNSRLGSCSLVCNESGSLIAARCQITVCANGACPVWNSDRVGTGVPSRYEARFACYVLHKVWLHRLQHKGRRRSLLQKQQRTTLRRHKRDCNQGT
jgi:hypothetical protein